MDLQHFSSIQQLEPDAIFHMARSYEEDADEKKINVGIGAYRDDQGRPWVLPVVRKAEQMILNDTSLNHEYLPITGLASFIKASASLVLGNDHEALLQNRVCGIQAISGTGALRMGAELLHRIYPNSTVFLSDPTWANHKLIFKEAGFQNIRNYAYFNPRSKNLDFNAMLNDLKSCEQGIVVLHACAHNPTGIDPTQEQWKQIANVVIQQKHFAFFDCAYQGFASGDLDRDAWAVRYFAKHMELIVAQSFAKNMGLYNERVGCLTIVGSSAKNALATLSQCSQIQRSIISNPPAFGARVAGTILNDPTLFQEWVGALKVMSGRIISMREELYKYLQESKTPGTWNHIVDQIGMFSFTGLDANQSKTMTKKFHVYMTDNGRISMAGLNSSNVKYFAECIDWVVRNVK